MANIEKPKFNILDVSGNNYLSWCLDVELHLQGQGLVETLVVTGKYNEKDEANALIFIRRHLPDALKPNICKCENLLIYGRGLRSGMTIPRLLCSHKPNMIGNI